MSKAQFLKDNLKPGEEYAGIVLGKNSEPDYHLILLPCEIERADWRQSVEWAQDIGGQLPTRREQVLLFANLPEHFKPKWYWSGEQHASHSGFAWYQHFNIGYQYYNHNSFEGRARAVRRLSI